MLFTSHAWSDIECVYVEFSVLFTSAFYSPRASFRKLTERSIGTFAHGTFVGTMSLPTERDDAVVPTFRKFRKMNHIPKTATLTVAATLAHLKHEVLTLKANGIHQYVEEGDAKVKEELKAKQLYYMSQLTEAVYTDTDGKEHAVHNAITFEDFKKKHSEYTCDLTGAHHANLGAENSLNLYCNLVNSLKIGTTASDGNPIVILEKSTGQNIEKEGKKKMPGGFSTGYESVATKDFSKDMQDRCLFGFPKATKFANECTGAAANLNTKVSNLMAKLFPDYVLQSEGVHVLFNWNEHSLFTYHTDQNSEVTVIVNLSPAKSSFHIAGMEEEAKYNEPGDAFVLPSAAWHRSGMAERRTVKVAYFFKLMKVEAIPEETTEDEGPLDLSKTGYEKKPDPTEEMPTQEDSGPEAPPQVAQLAQLAEVSVLQYMQDMQKAGSETNSVANADAEMPGEGEGATE